MYEDKERNWKHGQLIESAWSFEGCFRFRCGPVSGVRARRAGGGMAMRHMRHINNRRIRQDHIEQGFSFRCKYIPDPWDDYFMRTQKCWKKYRRTQYK